MEMNEFIDLLQQFVDEKYSELMIKIRIADSNIVTGRIYMGSCFNIEKSETINVNVVKARIKEMLYTMRDKLNKDIERIEDAETKDS